MSARRSRGAVVLGVSCVLGLLVAVLLLTAEPRNSGGRDAAPVPQRRDEGFGVCSTQDSTCMTRVAGRMAQRDPQDALVMWQQYAAANPEARLYCHSVYHVIGRVAGQGASSVWDAIAGGEDGCNNGYNHGVVEGYADGLSLPTLLSKMSEICLPGDDTRAGVDVLRVSSNCVHGVGHALVIKSRGDWREPIAACERELAEAMDRVSCSDGIWMGWSDQVAQNGGDGGLADCFEAPQYAREGCLGYAPRIEWSRQNGDGTKVMLRCAEGDKTWSRACALGVGRVVAVLIVDDVAQVLQICRTVEDLSPSCMGGYVTSALGLIEQGAIDQSTLDALLSQATPAERDAAQDATSRHTRTD